MPLAFSLWRGSKRFNEKISCLGFAQSCTKERATETRKAILNEWKEVRRHFLNEISIEGSLRVQIVDS